MKRLRGYIFYIFRMVIAIFVLSVCVCKNETDKAAAEKAYLAAVEAYAEQQYGTALEFIGKAKRIDSKFYQADFLEGKVLFFQGKMKEAEECFHELLKKYPSYTEARIWYMRCLIISGENDKVLSMLERELSFNSTDWRIYYLYALLGQKTDNYAQRLSMNRKAEIMLEESVKVYIDMALVWQALGMDGRAREYLRKAEVISGGSTIRELEAALEQAIREGE